LYLEQAGNASSVRWRAARVRIDHLLSSAIEDEQRNVKKESPKPKENSQESSTNTGGQTSRTSEGVKDVQDTQQVAHTPKLEGNDVGTSAEKNRNQQAKKNE